MKLSGLRINASTAKLVSERLEQYCLARGLRELHIKFAGGEPTLAIREIDEFCKTLKSRQSRLRISFGILTNGVFDPSEIIPVLLAHKMRVSVSIDGFEKSHNRIRYLKHGTVKSSTWDIIGRNVLLLKRAGIRPYFLFTVTQKNYSDLDLFGSFVHDLGCGFRLSLERSHRSIDFELQQDIAAFLSEFYSRRAKSAPVTIRFDRDAKFAEWTLDRKKISACNTCRGYIAVGREGGVASCQMRLDEPVGNLREERLEACINKFGMDIRSEKLFHPEQKSGGCTRCEFRFTCAGGCPQHTRDVYDDLDRPSPWCFVYGTLLPSYIEACAVHLARRAMNVQKALGSAPDHKKSPVNEATSALRKK